ncbi:DUF222 domain-containing protein [Geodermatophilus amargosae]|uniref:DUF222 domain-containing protein n=1 Tax=Geodermatophilus amargosae TaxID=1296565 RepID=UPI001FE8BEDB|nr:DUF222 domain-containing protein [Geodermatophilus amargosae]
MQEVAGPGSLIERALAGWLVEQPAPLRRLPVALLSREQKAAELQRVQAIKARAAAYEAELVLGLADDSPDDDDPAPGTPGARARSWKPDPELPGVSEFFPAELAVVLNCGRLAASQLAHRAWTYRTHLPATWAAMAAGELDEYRARTLVEVLEHTDPAVARQVEARVLPEAAQLTVGKLKKRALALLLELDAEAADRRRAQLGGAPTSGSTRPRRRAWPPSPPICPPTSPPPATRWSTSWPGCSRPTATSGPSVNCAPWCSPTCCNAPGTTPAHR